MSMRRVGSALIAGVIVVSAVGVSIFAGRGFPSRLNAAAAQINGAVGTNFRCAISDYLLLGLGHACTLGLPSRNPEDADVVLLGNSHAQMYAPVVKEILGSLSLHGLLVPADRCLPTYGMNVHSACISLADGNIDVVARLQRTRIVIIGTTWDDPPVVSDERKPKNQGLGLTLGLDHTISRLLAAGKRVILIGPIATPKWDVASVVSRSLAFGWPVKQQLYESEESFQREFSGALDHYENRTDVVFVRPDKIQCASGRCVYIQDGRSLFADANHLAAGELERFRPAFEAAVRRALSSQ